MPYAESIDGEECYRLGFERLRAELGTALRERDESLALRQAQMATVLHTIGGTVEGYPTSALNYLQRLRALVAAEKERDDRAAQAESARYMIEKARNCERAEAEAARLRGERNALLGIVKTALYEEGYCEMTTDGALLELNHHAPGCDSWPPHRCECWAGNAYRAALAPPAKTDGETP